MPFSFPNTTGFGRLPIIMIATLLVVTIFSRAYSTDDIPYYQDQVFVPNIRTVQLYVDPILLSDPVIPLIGTAQLKLEFDDLNGGNMYYYYTIIHCNFDWTKSELSEFDYLRGFRE